MDIKERLREIRLATGLSQTKFAARVAVSHSYIADMEKGKKPINERIIRLIAAEFSVNLDWFRTGKGEMFDEQYDIQVSEAVNIVKTLDAENRELAVELLRGMAEWQTKNQALNSEDCDCAETP